MAQLKMLVWTNKHGQTFVCARTPEEEARAWLYLFEQVDTFGHMLDELDTDEFVLYKLAQSRDAKAAQSLLEKHSNFDYEEIREEYVIIPPEIAP